MTQISQTHLYKDSLLIENNNSDVSDIDPEDLASIVQGIDDMDDALFGFKPKQTDSQQTKSILEETKTFGHSKPAVKPKVLDFPDGDPLADLSLSDEDFYDVEEKTASSTKKKDSNIHSPTVKINETKLTRTEKIAHLYGLNDDDDAEVVVDKKKKQDSASDWLGIKDSPVKTLVDSKDVPNSDWLGIKDSPVKTPVGTEDRPTSDLFGMKDSPVKTLVKNKDIVPKSTLRATTLTGDPAKDAGEIQVGIESKKLDTLEMNTAGRRSFKGNETLGILTKNQVNDQNKFDLTSVRPAKTSSEFNLSKISENLSDKKSKIFSMFEEDYVQEETTRKSTTFENTAGAAVGGELLGQYTPSSGVGRRLGRRRDTTPGPTSSTAILNENWIQQLENPTPQEEKKESLKSNNTELKSSGVNTNDGLPLWFGGDSVTLDKGQGKGKRPLQSGQDKLIVQVSENHLADKAPEVKPQKTKCPEEEVVDTVKEALLSNSEQSHQTVLALQQTEAQLATALELQTTQTSLEAVCARQHRLLTSQEKQLAQLMTQQMSRQSEVERQITAQQQRIQLLLDTLSMNVLTSAGFVEGDKYPVGDVILEKDNQQIKKLEAMLQGVNLENEELRLRMKMIEKHYKLEFESFQTLHRKEIEFWEDQLLKQKELCEQMKEDYKEKIKDLKQEKAVLVAEHNERVDRLRKESAEDMKELMQFHKATLEQLTVVGHLAAPINRQGHQSTIEVWKPLDNHQLSEKEQELLKKEKSLSVLQDKLDSQKELFEKQVEENEAKLEHDKMKNEEALRQLKQEQAQFKHRQQQMVQEKKHLEDQYHVQRKMLEEMQEKVMSEQIDLSTQKLTLTEERARLEALAKLQGVSGSSSFDIVQSKAEVHGALEAARAAEMKAVEEGRKIKEKERALDNYQWKLREMEEDLVTRAEHLDRLMQISEAKEEASKKALEEAKTLEMRTEEKMKEVERRRLEVREKEQSLIRFKLDIAQEEIRINKKKEQLEHFLPRLLPEEALSIQPLKNVIDPKMLIMKLRAEKESEAVLNTHPVISEN